MDNSLVWPEITSAETNRSSILNEDFCFIKHYHEKKYWLSSRHHNSVCNNPGTSVVCDLRQDPFVLTCAGRSVTVSDATESDWRNKHSTSHTNIIHLPCRHVFSFPSQEPVKFSKTKWVLDEQQLDCVWNWRMSVVSRPLVLCEGFEDSRQRLLLFSFMFKAPNDINSWYQTKKYTPESFTEPGRKPHGVAVGPKWDTERCRVWEGGAERRSQSWIFVGVKGKCDLK